MLAGNNLQTVFRNLVESLQNIYSKKEAGSIVRILLEHLGHSGMDLLINKSKTLSKSDMSFLNHALNRLQNHEPVQYITGTAHFYGLEFMVNPNVLIPRSETEEMVDLVLRENKQVDPKILDIGTGSGCIALTLKINVPHARVDALDISEDAIKTAIENSKRLNTNIHFHQIDILHEAFLPGRYDIIVSNPPYINEDEKASIARNVLDYEPVQALFVPEEAPLAFYECIIELSSRHLNTNGKLYFEINETLGKEVEILLKETGFQQTRVIKDLNEKDRIATGTWVDQNLTDKEAR